MRSLDVALKFMRSVEITDYCWIWTGETVRGGYGRMRIGKKKVPASHVSWGIFYGNKQNDLLALHKCDNPACVNPNHLFLGTQKQNIQDALSKKRFPAGETHHNAKLSTSQVEEIRSKYHKGHRYHPSATDQNSLAREYGVDQQTIWRIVNLKGWKQ